MSLVPPGAGRVPFPWETYFLLSRDRGRSECPCTACLLSNFYFKRFYLFIRERKHRQAEGQKER